METSTHYLVAESDGQIVVDLGIKQSIPSSGPCRRIISSCMVSSYYVIYLLRTVARYLLQPPPPPTASVDRKYTYDPFSFCNPPVRAERATVHPPK